MPDPLTRFRWLEGDCPLDEIFCVSFFHGLEPAGVLSRLGVDPRWTRRMSFEEFGDFFVHVDENVAGTADGSGCFGALKAGDWSAVVEPMGWKGASLDAPGLSRDTTHLAVLRHDYAEHDFVYAVDGSVLTRFDPRMPDMRHGEEPDVLNSRMRAAGLNPRADDEEDWPDEPVASSFALMADVTGVPFTPGLLEQPLLAGCVAGERAFAGWGAAARAEPSAGQGARGPAGA
ncbi:DUF6461 domain-containing protein [Streptomyces ovatisporus]|uniref:DUF6461 domain-containing protein n=1 Tax=Streptomyces ovatisporus TaxID=1128682 RepID=A0ABV9ADQ5_9ACTN